MIYLTKPVFWGSHSAGSNSPERPLTISSNTEGVQCYREVGISILYGMKIWGWCIVIYAREGWNGVSVWPSHGFENQLTNFPPNHPPNFLGDLIPHWFFAY